MTEQPMEDPRITARRQSRKVRGIPVQTPETKGFANTRAFQEQLIAVRADKSTTPRQRRVAEDKLIARRRRQLGE